MRLQTRLSLGICTGMALAAAACFGLTLWSADRLLDDNVRSRLAAVETEVDASIDAESRRASSMARLIAALPPVVDAFAARDREALAAIVLPAFPAVRDDGVGQFQFHTPPATSFLRVHSPAQFGDDLSSLRSTVVETNRSHQSVRGVEVGQFGLGIRGVEPVSSSGRHIGSVEFGLSLDAAFVAAYTERTGTMLALHLGENGQGTVLASSFPEGFAFDAADIAQGFSGPFLVKSIRVGATRRAALMYPLLDYSGTPVGVVTVAIDRTELDAMSQQIITVFGGLAVAIVLSGLGLAWLLNRGIAGPLVSFTASLQELGAGKQNVRIFGVGRRDEIGELAAAVQGIQQNAVDKAEADRLADERRNSQARLERANLMSRLAGDFEAAVGSIVTGVASASKEMEQAARALSSSSQQTSAKASTVSTASEQASANVQTVAAAAEELSASVNAINDQVTRSTSMSQQARSQAQQTVTKVSDMAANAEKIGDIISLIRRIADQTNLLALNATIEAARAGEAGKGFAVVADEVKLLADQTATATTEIASQIGQIQTSTAESADAIRHIASVIEELSEATTIIAAGIDEQGAATREIARNVHLASGATVKVNNAIGDVMQEASGSSAAASQVLASASGLSHQSDRLSAAVASFVAAVLSDADGAQDITGRRAAA